MSDYQLEASKFYKAADFSAGGVISPSKGHRLYGEQSVRLFVVNAGPSNVIEIQAQVNGATSWNTIGSFTGPGHSPLMKVDGYDYIRFNVLRYQAHNGATPRLIASGSFHPDGEIDQAAAALETTNLLLLEMLSLMEKMYQKQVIMQYHIEEITGEELIGDL